MNHRAVNRKEHRDDYEDKPLKFRPQKKKRRIDARNYERFLEDELEE